MISLLLSYTKFLQLINGENFRIVQVTNAVLTRTLFSVGMQKKKKKKKRKEKKRKHSLVFSFTNPL